MTRAEFIQRAAVGYAPASSTAESATRMARGLAEEVAKIAPFDEKDETADAIDALFNALDSIDKSLELIARELPNAGRGS